MNIEYKGGFLCVDGVSYVCTEKAEQEVADSKNQREYVERLEHLAYLVFALKSRENDGLFRKYQAEGPLPAPLP